MVQIGKRLQVHVDKLHKCSKCPDMIGPVVSGDPVVSPVMLVGQAPGPHEGRHGKPFAWTAGKTLFKWFNKIGMEEEAFRSCVYMAAVCRCFPGKNPKGGDRVPNKQEIANCQSWMDAERQMLEPKLILPVGKLAISQFVKVKKLTDVVGQTLRAGESDMICLPHPSGASTWHRTEPGMTLLDKALGLIKKHPAWKQIVA